MSSPIAFVKQLAALRERQRQLALHSGAIGEDPLLDFYVKATARLLDCERCSIFIRDPASGSVWLKSGTGLGVRDIVVDVDASVVGQVVRSGQPVIVEGMEHKEGAHKHVDAKTGFRTRNILCIPVWTLDGTTVAGAVQVLNKKEGAAFNEEDQATLLDMAHFLQLAIETAFVNQESARTLGRLSRIASGLVAFTALLALAFIAALLLR